MNDLQQALPASLAKADGVGSRSRRRDSATSDRVLYCLFTVTALTLLASLYAVFFVAPVEQRMGPVYKLFYFHVPAAYAAYLGFGLCAICSAVDLLKRRDEWDALALASARVGLLFCVALMIIGAMWARKAWGVYWTWEPRLTTTMLIALIYVAYVMLRSLGGGEVERRFGAALAICGLGMIPVVHISVQKWSGTHPTVITSRGGGLDPQMWPPLVLAMIAVTLLCTLLIWVRARFEVDRLRYAALVDLAVEKELVSEDAL